MYSENANIEISFNQVTFVVNLVKKLKNLDIPDLIKAVKSKSLPKEALRGVLTRFKTG